MKLVAPNQPAQVHGHRRRHRARRRLGGGNPRRARLNVLPSPSSTARGASHSIAAQGGINAAKNYKNDGDSVYRLFYDTIKGGDFRAREANVYRLAEASVEHHRPVRRPGRAVRAGVRRLLANRRSAAPRCRARSTRAARRASSSCSGPTALSCARSAAGRCKMFARREMLDLVVVDGRRAASCPVTSRPERHRALRRRRRAALTGGYGNVYFLSTNAGNTNVTAAWRCAKAGVLGEPVLRADHADLIRDRQLSARAAADEEVRATRPRLGSEEHRRSAVTARHPGRDRDYLSSDATPASATWSRVMCLAAARRCATRAGCSARRARRYLDFADAIGRLGRQVIDDRYGHLFDIYHRITGEDSYLQPDACLRRSTTPSAGCGSTTT